MSQASDFFNYLKSLLQEGDGHILLPIVRSILNHYKDVTK